MRKTQPFSLIVMITGLFILAGCSTRQATPTPLPTSTLAPLVSLTPRVTATPFITRTPPPTFTPIPSETPIPPTPTTTPSPTVTPPVVGIIGGMKSINVREGPGTTYAILRALVPGAAIKIIYQNADGSWYNIEMEDGTQGWVWANPVYIESTATPFPTLTPSPDYTALALGTALPTALVGGGTITPTPPPAAVTATPPGTPAIGEPDSTGEPTESFLPIIDVGAINMTATALAGGLVQVSPPPTLTESTPPSPTASMTPTAMTQPTAATTTPDPAASPQTPAGTPIIPTPSGNAIVQQGVDILAMCNNTAFRHPPPANLAAGSTIDVFWGWFVTDPKYMQQHLDAVNYEVRVNGVRLSNWRQHGTQIAQEGDWYVKYWYVPFGPLDAGPYTITYSATWSERITDGMEAFGPGTTHLVEEGRCDFVVR